MVSGPGRALPRLVVVADSAAIPGRAVLDVVAEAVAGGARAVLVRDKHRPPAERRALAAAVRQLLDPVAGFLLVASDPDVADHPAVRADGLHLAAADPWPAGWDRLVGRSCHTRDEVAWAAAEGCHYATLSPIWPSPSKPGYGPALGAWALSDLPLPTWALGGVDAVTAPEAMAAGASGVAVLGAVLHAADPAAATAALVRAVAGTASAEGRASAGQR